MQNVTPISIDSKQSKQERGAFLFFLGGVSGFVFYWLAFALPFPVYGSNTLFFLLYTAVLHGADAAVGADRHHPQHAVARPSDPDAAADRRHRAVPVLAGVQLLDRVVRAGADAGARRIAKRCRRLQNFAQKRLCARIGRMAEDLLRRTFLLNDP